MNILIVGGTGLTGAHAAFYLRDQGHDVTIMSRSALPADSVLAGFPHLKGSYIGDAVSVDDLRGFDAMVFCAAVDIRCVPPDTDPNQFYHDANTIAVPRFFEKAKEAGMRRAVLVSSYYPHIVPEKIATDPYVRSRHLSSEGARVLTDENFKVCSLDAPFIIGHVPGLAVDHLAALALYGAGHLQGVPMVAPAGGMNFIASQSLSEAIAAALDRGTAGKAYLVGDENLSWKQYLEMFSEAAGNQVDWPVTGDEHPLFPDAILYAGRNAVVHYQPEVDTLNYSRNRIREAVEQIVQSVFADA